MATATLIKDVSENFRGDAAVFRLDPPFDGIETVVSSAVDLGPSSPAHEFDLLFGIDRSEETMIFASDENGVVKSWGELAVVATKSHEDALAELGYTLAE